MESYRSEEEQVEALKRWWDENGRSTLIGIVVALVAVFGWQGWQGHRTDQRAAASDLYQQLLDSAAAGDQSMARLGEVERLAARLKDDFGATTYAQFAGLHLARVAVVADDLEGAERELRWVLSQADSGSELAVVAQQRLARVIAAKGDTGAALALLDSPRDSSFAATYSLARGDVLLQAGREDEARGAYEQARALAAQYPGQVNLLTVERKLAHLSPQQASTSAGEVQP